MKNNAMKVSRPTGVVNALDKRKFPGWHRTCGNVTFRAEISPGGGGAVVCGVPAFSWVRPAAAAVRSHCLRADRHRGRPGPGEERRGPFGLPPHRPVTCRHPFSAQPRPRDRCSAEHVGSPWLFPSAGGFLYGEGLRDTSRTAVDPADLASSDHDGHGRRHAPPFRSVARRRPRRACRMQTCLGRVARPSDDLDRWHAQSAAGPRHRVERAVRGVEPRMGRSHQASAGQGI